MRLSQEQFSIFYSLAIEAGTFNLPIIGYFSRQSLNYPSQAPKRTRGHPKSPASKAVVTDSRVRAGI
jgi:hypothetical protein